ncbi:hypothetical protein [Magnetospirillum sulfuroxidans]|uniref:Uncharacterized protein n=1 Tax=Magnetospirillum sulfuroxidans TaxID=611300 RepID=A0ABS5IB56_9PROT|nr:hypothetical protein [Magnetospirillum sulfuroxidans]MBR9971657.1 hypothetical protein [Magnetospirillum sulfuroxidans]
MSGAGNGITNTLSVGSKVIATCNGYAFFYDFGMANDPIRNDLTGVGKGEVRIAYDSGRMVAYFGCNGHIQAVNISNFTTCLWSTPITLPNALNTVTSVVASSQGYVYAGANGYVYKVNTEGQVLYSNPLTGTGNNEVRLALSPDQKTLFVGTNGQMWALSADKMTELWKVTLPGWDWGSSASNTVSLLSFLNQSSPGSGRILPWLFAGCNGWIYSFDLSLAKPQVTAMTQSLQASLGAGDTRLACDLASGLLYVGLSGCGACLDMSLRQPVKWTYEFYKSAGRVANVAVTPTQIFVGTNGQLALIEGGNCKSNGQVPDGGTDQVSLATGPASFDPASIDSGISVELIAGVNGYVSAYLVGTA